ncbi:hypothetical protein DBV05_g10117 [Lasiodiplodia theobromae]|uniref:RelA/SpoT domain-containing protein n=1 Tax=Lasiodiplodia theobromae TaxID=45133 RepID=A0A5N5D0N0_9PEZI|nr:hypothetical protein DBV05_g10117 [Lasiodiplodia theobromae]
MDSIPIIFAHRGKDKHSLERKLKERNRSKLYLNVKDIKEDIVDLAGVRIALYMPPHKAQIDCLLRTTFELQDTREHPDGHNHPTPYRSSLGYQASHYRVRLFQSQLEGLEDSVRTLQDPVVEIQVVSILHHVWADLQHDIEYKSLGGSPSGDEQLVLGLINEAMRLGERHLEALHDINIKRLESQDKPFANKWELGSWLFNRLSRIMNPETVNLGPIEVLRRFVSLRGVEKDTPDKLESVLEEMDFQDPWPASLQDISAKLGSEESRISVLIIAHIIQKKSARTGSQQAFAIAKSQPTHELKLKIMASSFIWLSDLFPQTSRWAQPVTKDAISKKRAPGVRWLLTSIVARRVMIGEEQPSEPTKKTIDELWGWMEASSISLLCLVFSISKMGVCRHFPKEDEFTKLRSVYGVFEKFF